jgi:hypothetical protein
MPVLFRVPTTRRSASFVAALSGIAVSAPVRWSFYDGQEIVSVLGDLVNGFIEPVAERYMDLDRTYGRSLTNQLFQSFSPFQNSVGP